MSSHSRISPALLSSLILMFAVVLISSSALAQSDSNPQWDLFLGYQWLHPGGTVPAALGNPAAPTPYRIPDMSTGFGAALTYNFDRHWGGEFDFGHNWGNDNYELTVSGGPRFMVRTDGANYFIHALISYNRLNISLLSPNDGIGAILGGGMDLPISKRFQLRLFEADYVWARHNYANQASQQFPSLQHPQLQGVRLRTGLLFAWGGAPEVSPTASCSVQPTEVMAGQPITATANASNFNPKHPVTYSWSGNGGTVTGKDSTATIDTTNVAPGSYAVSVQVTDPKAKKNNNEARCSANYTIKPNNPPTISCSASPASVVVGATATITCNASSPDGVPVRISNWSASSASISGSGNTAALNTTGASPGSVTVTATATDTRGLSSQASTQVMVESPPVSPRMEALEQRLALRSIYFPTGMPPAAKPLEGLVPSQQKTLLDLAKDFREYLQAKPDAHLVLEAHADERGSDALNQALTVRRANRVKGFLVENGIPEANIETVAYGKQHNLTAQEVQDSINNNPTLTPEERQRSLRNLTVLKWASNRRVDITLKSGGKTETSVKQFPFNAADALTLIGGRQAEAKPKAASRKRTRPPQTKRPQ